jgi:site-specific DNA-methyltransferase (adenine-specific)
MKTPPTYEVLIGDCAERLKELPDASVHLIVTSPPYADQRKNTYGGISPDEYVKWFLPIAKQCQRVLAPTGSMIINIKEKVVKGQRHRYVLHLIDALVERQGWLWTEEYIWFKKNSMPGKWPNRFRDAWERCLHFTKQPKFHMYQEAVRQERGDWADKRLANPHSTDSERRESATKSGFGVKVANWANRDTVYPHNVLHLAPEARNVGHSAAFPISLPAWFIKLFSAEGDIVLDPFSGSGSTGVAAVNLHRNYIGVELHQEHARDSLRRISQADSEAESLNDAEDLGTETMDEQETSFQSLFVRALEPPPEELEQGTPSEETGDPDA